jgi:hypothetical protein
MNNFILNLLDSIVTNIKPDHKQSKAWRVIKMKTNNFERRFPLSLRLHPDNAQAIPKYLFQLIDCMYYVPSTKYLPELQYSFWKANEELTKEWNNYIEELYE